MRTHPLISVLELSLVKLTSNFAVTSKMTQEKIFKMLLKNDIDYANLREDCAETIANSISNMIYDSMKSKSAQASINRVSLIKFLQILGGKSGNQSTGLMLEMIKEKSDFFTASDDWEEVDHKRDISKEIMDFYERKDKINQQKVAKLELVRKYDQEALTEAKFPGTISSTSSFYECDKSIVKSLFQKEPSNRSRIRKKLQSIEYREAQIKFAYALPNLQEFQLLEIIMQNLLKYPALLPKEESFLIFLGHSVHNSEIQSVIGRNFSFVYEKILLKLCTELIKLNDSNVVEAYFRDLNMNTEFLGLQKLCNGNEDFKCKLKVMLFELYSISYCNVNVLRLCDRLTEKRCV